MTNDTTKAAPDERAELKPCPFCGGAAQHANYTLDEKFAYAEYHSITCADCNVGFSAIDDQNPQGGYAIGGTGLPKVLDLWNTRTPPQVKPLVWGLTSYRMPEVECVLGTYRISGARDYGFNCHIGRKALEMSDGRTNFATIDDAKAAAQADYTRRILDALS